jgi:glycosyltransferase involved in cell wall biosynthesis
MSKFGRDELERAGYPALYVPHAIDTTVFRPHPDREELRRALRMPEDTFIVGMVANNQGANPPRKAFPQVFEAFAELHSIHPDSMLYLHTDIIGRNKGVNLAALSAIFGLEGDALGFSDQTALRLDGFGPERMAAMYASFDVLVNPSYGEGFGIPIIEAQACGTPVIVSDFTSMTELCGAGWTVGGERTYDPAHGSFMLAPSVSEIAAVMLDAYDRAGTIRGEAREFALAYDADRVFEEGWLPILEELERPREVPALRPAERPKLELVEAR